MEGRVFREKWNIITDVPVILEQKIRWDYPDPFGQTDKGVNFSLKEIK